MRSTPHKTPRFRLPRDFTISDPTTADRFAVPAGSIIPGVIRDRDRTILVSSKLQARAVEPFSVVTEGNEQLLVTDDEVHDMPEPFAGAPVKVHVDGKWFLVVDENTVIVECEEERTGNKPATLDCYRLVNTNEQSAFSESLDKKPDILPLEEFEDRWVQEHLPQKLMTDADEDTGVEKESGAPHLESTDILSNCNSEGLEIPCDDSDSSERLLENSEEMDIIVNDKVECTNQDVAENDRNMPPNVKEKEVKFQKLDFEVGCLSKMNTTDFDNFRHIVSNWNSLIISTLPVHMQRPLQATGQFDRISDNRKFLLHCLRVISKLYKDDVKPVTHFFGALAQELKKRYPNEFDSQLSRGRRRRKMNKELAKRIYVMWQDLSAQKKEMKNIMKSKQSEMKSNNVILDLQLSEMTDKLSEELNEEEDSSGMPEETNEEEDCSSLPIKINQEISIVDTCCKSKFQSTLTYLVNNWDSVLASCLPLLQRESLQKTGRFLNPTHNTRFLNMLMDAINELVRGERPDNKFFRGLANQLEIRYPKEFDPDIVIKNGIVGRGRGGIQSLKNLHQRLKWIWYDLFDRKSKASRTKRRTSKEEVQRLS